MREVGGLASMVGRGRTLGRLSAGVLALGLTLTTGLRAGSSEPKAGDGGQIDGGCGEGRNQETKENIRASEIAFDGGLWTIVYDRRARGCAGVTEAVTTDRGFEDDTGSTFVECGHSINGPGGSKFTCECSATDGGRER